MGRVYSKNPPPKFSIGTLVQMQGRTDGEVFEIVEDHGNIGINGRRFYLLRTMTEAADTFAFPEELLEAVANNGPNAKPTTRKRRS